MTTKAFFSKYKVINYFYTQFKNDIVFSISFFLALISSFISQPSISYIDFKVLACLFNLMIVINAFEELKLLLHILMLSNA